MAAILENFIMNLSNSVFRMAWISPVPIQHRILPIPFCLFTPSQNHIAKVSYHPLHFNKTTTTIGKVHRSNFQRKQFDNIDGTREGNKKSIQNFDW
jgi:hypothetical protein